MYTVRPGDYLSKIAHAHGFSNWQCIYDHPQNQSFRDRRPNPNIIFPGDTLFVPDQSRKEELCQTGKSHRFRVSSGSNSLHVILKDAEGTPLRNLPYVLHIDGRAIRGNTDGTGAVRQPKISPQAEDASIEISGHRIALKIGHLDPVDASDKGASGVQGRLRNLGFYNGPATGSLDDETRHAIRCFQQAHELDEDADLSPALKSKLVDLHGS
jgi:N-acetylmuramoyl-L-alanine amidase